MGVARVHAVALSGVSGSLVEVEADLAQGLPTFTLVGLPDTAVAEARDRVRAAVVNSGAPWPGKRITVGLSPASLPKVGSGFDLAIAAAVLLAAGTLPGTSLARSVLLGELGLDGRVRPVRGVLPAVVAAVRWGADRVVVPAVQAAEAQLVEGVSVLGVRSLAELLAELRGDPPPASAIEAELIEPPPRATDLAVLDLGQVVGQLLGRRAVEVAAAGGHHAIFIGEPGCGKTMLAERLPGLLPDLDREQALEVTAVHSVAGVLAPGSPLVTRPPFSAPHHTATVAALVGGGSGVLRPGAASVAHRGVLFLDEAPEFHSGVLDALRQPMEGGEVRLARARSAITYPARFQLVLAANPCPCGRGTTVGGVAAGCECPRVVRRRYLARISGPLLDRVDLRLRLEPLSRSELFDLARTPEASAPVAARVAAVRHRQRERLHGTPWRCMAEVPGPELRARWPVPRAALATLVQGSRTGTLTARSADKVLRLAWTIADLAGRGVPVRDDVDEALLLREMA